MMTEHEGYLNALTDCYYANRDHMNHAEAVDAMYRMSSEHNLPTSTLLEAERRIAAR